MKMPGKKTEWAFRDKDMRRLLKKRELRSEEKEWRNEEGCDKCGMPADHPNIRYGCDCEDVD